jgi:hypothetical protein
MRKIIHKKSLKMMKRMRIWLTQEVPRRKRKQNKCNFSHNYLRDFIVIIYKMFPIYYILKNLTELLFKYGKLQQKSKKGPLFILKIAKKFTFLKKTNRKHQLTSLTE